MKILSIETSCDETAISLLEITETDSGTHFTVLGNVIHSQVDVHREYGGVFPKLAKREHQINLPIVLEQIMKNQDIPDYICVTSGPGLEPALWTGIVFAKELSIKWSASRRIPVIPVNHMEGHILSILVPQINGSDFVVTNDSIQFPAIALLISGGHTELVSVNAIGDYRIIGRTKDDAVGEAFDKVARILGLPYPGGPEVSKLASQYTTEALPDFPRPMIHTKDYDFSFSGLKTAVLYYSQKCDQPLGDADKIAIAHEFEAAATDVITKKTLKALEDFGAQTLIVGGGVSANTRIKESLLVKASELIPSDNIHFPARELTGDNALMIGLAGYYKVKKAPDAVYDDIRAEGNLQL